MATKPLTIQEKNLVYTVGAIQNGWKVYNFTKTIIYLEAKGKLLFGKQFKIHKEDLEVIYKLLIYTIQDKKSCQEINIDVNKGILLTGPVGCGKTSLMKLLPYVVLQQKRYKTIPTRSVVFEFNKNGHEVVLNYGNHNAWCFDDLGVEPVGKHYGQDCNVMGEILLSRYDLFLHSVSLNRQPIGQSERRNLTHITTNLNANEIEERYGERVRSRMRQMFNLISFDKNSEDKRG